MVVIRQPWLRFQHTYYTANTLIIFFFFSVNFVNGMSLYTKTYHLKYHEMKASYVSRLQEHSLSSKNVPCTVLNIYS